MNLLDLLREYGVDFRQAGEHHHATPGWANVDCPRCSPGSGHYRLGINLAHNFCSCWSCGYVPLIEALHELTKESPRELRNRLVGLEGVSRQQVQRASRLRVPHAVGPLLPVHRRYLRDRGIDADLVASVWGVQGIGLASRFAWSLYIPIFVSGAAVSYTTRRIGENARRRYESAPAHDEAVAAKSCLYGADFARHAVVVCEGPLDVWAVGPGAVATLGTAYTRPQLLSLAKYPVRAVCFDAEPAAQRRAAELCDALAAYEGKTVNVLLETGKDPAAASKSEIAKLRRKFLG